MTRRQIGRALLIASGCVPLLGLLGPAPDPTLLIYTLFVLAVLLRPVRHVAPSRSWAARFAAAVVGSGLVLECLAWTHHFLACAPNPALLHPQLLPDLVLAVGFYGSWALAWLVALRFFTFRLRQLFVAQGLFGILLEQQGAVLLAGLRVLPLGLALWLYVGLVYGAVVGIAACLAGLPRHTAQRNRWWKYPLAWFALLCCVLVSAAVWNGGLHAAHAIPAPQPICTSPLF